jgi:thymidylate synthase ThyX
MDVFDEYMKQWINEPIYQFTNQEAEVLDRFFTNRDRRVYFMHSLPANVAAALLAMFSRLKNARGLRGLFIDAFLPEMILGIMDPIDESHLTSAQVMKKYEVTGWGSFLEKIPGAQQAAKEFINTIGTDPEYLARASNVERVSRMLSLWLDAYGHNSIARTAQVSLCLERVSMLTAKTTEWTRPGAAYIETSSRYVQMDNKGVFPIDQLLNEYGISPNEITDGIHAAFDMYRYHLQHDGGLQSYLQDKYAYLVRDGRVTQKQLNTAIEGEVCDVIGNILPAATLTSVGVGVLGESLPTILQHLHLDETPENNAIITAIIREAEKTGAAQFIKHWKPTPWKTAGWMSLSTRMFSIEDATPQLITQNEICAIEETLTELMRLRVGSELWDGVDSMIKSMVNIQRDSHDKLPNEFEHICCTIKGLMTFRSWRDAQRHGYCTHNRTALTPLLGFYKYPKPHPTRLDSDFQRVHEQNTALFLRMQQKGVPVRLREYPMTMGNNVGYTIGANLAQWEFMLWQRTKHGVHDEVRERMLKVDEIFRKLMPWWHTVSRTDRTAHYVFARTPNPIVLVK